MQTQTATQDHSHVYSKLSPGIVLGDPKEDLEAAVYLIGDEPKASIWRISQNLTDRWGDLNEFLAEQKPLKQLVESPELLERLRGQMWDEISFVVRKDGRYGILFEIEYCSKESEAVFYQNREADAWYNNLKSSQENIAYLAKALAALQAEYPGVEFCVPHEDNMVEGRNGIWAFIPDGHLDQGQREKLGLALLAF